MLRSFRLGNHRSFRDEQELLLMPALPGDDRPVVPVAAVYGANASGKSNLVSGLTFMQAAVRDSFASWAVEERIPRQPFRPARGEHPPSVFVVDLVAEGVRYTYGFGLDDETVREEWLYSYPEKRRRVLFERDAAGIRFGSTVTELKSKLEIVEELTRPNALFLSVGVRLGLGPLMPAYRWFDSQLCIRKSGMVASLHAVASRVGTFVSQNPDEFNRLVSLLAAADVGITGLHVVETGTPPLDVRVAKADERWFELELTHEHGAPFDLAEESAGTRNWLDILPTVIEALDGGRVLVVDEIDASLHPLLSAQLVGLFRSAETNVHSAQLIFTTHDASLLGTMLGDRILERDQIWFAEKRVDGATELVALTDFKPRKEANLERRYLAGSYGGVPVLERQEFVDAVLRR